VPEAVVRDEIACGRLRQLVVRDAHFTRTLATAVRRGRRLPLAAQRFLELVHRHYPPAAAARAESDTGPAAHGRPRTGRARRKATRRSPSPS